MSPRVDVAILKALALDTSTTSIVQHGGRGFSLTFELITRYGDQDKLFFVKTGTGTQSEIMFAGEHTSLNAIHEIVPSLCPKSYAHGPLSDQSGFFLVTDFLNLGGDPSSSGTGLSLAKKLAKLHSTPAPTPPGHEEPVFGFPVPTCCGDTVQDNAYDTSWAHFYADSRLRAIWRSCERQNGTDNELRELVERTASKVVPALLSDDHLKSADGGQIIPVVVHGDLWSGNHGQGSVGSGPIEEVVFDPSSSYSHSEFEFGIMKMFGGFGAAFDEEYYEAKGKRDKPEEEWADRVRLYELYHHLNHYSIFGRNYRDGALSIMAELIEKYG